jgi:type VII secretion integral membrane protein EccD
MAGFTRLVVSTATRRATVVVPDDEAVGTLLPQLAQLLEHPTGVGTLVLVTPLGDPVDPDLSAAEQDLADGSVLRLLRAEDAPPPPEVTDVTDAVAETLDGAAARWDGRHRIVAGALGLGALALALGGVAASAGAGWVAPVVLVVALVAAIVAGRVGRSDGIAVLATGAAVGAALPTGFAIRAAAYVAQHGGGLDVIQSNSAFMGSLAEGPVIGLGLAALALGIGLGLGRGRRAPLIGATVGAVLGGLAAILLISGLSAAETSAVIALLGAVALGMLPQVALAAARVTELDDAVIAGDLPPRTTVRARVDEAYAALGWGVWVVALALGAAALVLIATPDVWSGILGAAAVLVLLLRTRIMPFAVQAWPLWVAAVAATIGGLALRDDVPIWTQLIALAAGAVLIAALALARPSMQLRVRLRRAGDALEVIAVVAMLPAILGVFGVYVLMLGAFS